MEAARAGWSQSWILSILINWQNKERERERERERFKWQENDGACDIANKYEANVQGSTQSR